MAGGRPVSRMGRLVRAGFQEPSRAADLAGAQVLSGLIDLEAPEGGDDCLLMGLGATADPDLALVMLVRLLEAAHGEGHLGRAAHEVDDLREVLARDGERRRRVLGVLGASAALDDHLTRHPGHWREAADATPMTADERVADLVAAVDADRRGERSAEDALRVAYRAQLLSITALDVTADDPTRTLPATAAALADLAAAALEAALEAARRDHPREAAAVRLAVIGLGKCGGHELNYVSDVDVVFVAQAPSTPNDEPDDNGAGSDPGGSAAQDEGRMLACAGVLASALMRMCSAHTGEGTLWPVDAALRPEGKNGPLVRTVASHESYYRRWAKTWEFQALLKARHVAGDAEVSREYLDAVRPLVWEAAGRDNFVEDVQAMRRRVERHVPAPEAERQIKLGPGGLRDVEFTVQLLQLVHGRSDDTLRSATTLDALAALVAGGYVARDDAQEFDHAYRLLRTIEHRIQLYRLRRTHLMPTSQVDLRRVGRSLGLRTDPDREVLDLWRRHKRQVRRLHQRIFYRPLLSAAARLSADDARLAPDAARERLLVLGFRDPAGALRHLEALMTGTSRTAAIQRTLLPVMLGWFADEADPDQGLLTFRRVSESLGGTHWYLKMLRDEGRAAERLAHVLARSRYAADLLIQAPESVQFLAEDEGLTPRDRAALVATMRSAVGRRDDAEAALHAVRVIRRQELFRIALAHLVGAVDDDRVRMALTDLTEALLESALYIATKSTGQQRGEPVPVDLALIGLGRLGGAECGYASDADLVAVHRPHEGVDEADAARAAAEVVQELRRLLRRPGPDPVLDVDLDLRPEGKAGPLSRTPEGYRAYYARWGETWERQALLRARPVAGDVDLQREFVDVVDPVRYPRGGIDSSAVKDVRRLKARMEAERLPRGADPKTHFKLGRGGLSDVEWSVQLVQLQHAGDDASLRTTSTLDALHAAVALGHLRADDAQHLETAWRLASALRDATVLWRVRGAESLPADIRDAEGISRILGRAAGEGGTLAEHYLRLARRARSVTERVFYARDDAP